MENNGAAGCFDEGMGASGVALAEITERAARARPYSGMPTYRGRFALRTRADERGFVTALRTALRARGVVIACALGPFACRWRIAADSLRRARERDKGERAAADLREACRVMPLFALGADGLLRFFVDFDGVLFGIVASFS